jgi:hypothetical protein
MKWMLAFVFLALAFHTTAFGDNVRPGDRDYPDLNTNAHIDVPVSGRVPAGWDLRLFTTYYAKDNAMTGATIGGLGCGRIFVEYKLHVVRDGDTFTTTIPMDRYQEGRCGWHVTTVRYTVVKRSGDPETGGRLAVTPQDIIQTYPPTDATDHRNQVDLWCWDDPSEPKYWINGIRLDCENAKDAVMSPMKYIPAAKRGDNRAVYFLPDTKNLSFIFHDLDAEAMRERAQQK